MEVDEKHIQETLNKKIKIRCHKHGDTTSWMRVEGHYYCAFCWQGVLDRKLGECEVVK